MVDPQSELVMLKFSPLTFPYVIVACFKSHPPLFDRSRLNFTTRSFRYSDTLTERNYVMTYQGKRIEEGSRCIFTKLIQCFHIHPRCENRSINRELRKSPLGIVRISLSNSPQSVQMIIRSRGNSF